jgi:hypothetical protein
MHEQEPVLLGDCMAKLLKHETNTAILDHIGKILDLSKANGIDSAFFENARKHLDFVSTKMNISPLQAALFAHVFDTSIGNHAWRYESSLMDSLKCSKCDYLKYLNEIDDLVKKQYVSKVLDNQALPHYAVPRDIIFALRKGKAIKPVNYDNISIEKLFARLEYIFKARYNDELTVEEMFGDLEVLIQNNQQLLFTKKILSYNLSQQNRNLLIYFCHKEINNGDIVDFAHIEKHFSEIGYGGYSGRMIRSLKTGNHPLQKHKLIENVNDNGFCIKEKFFF